MWRSTRGSAAAEMALVAPLLLVFVFGTVELGLYFWSEHILLKGVRDGAVYASRQPITAFDCAAATVDPTVVANTKALVRGGAVSGGSDRLATWSDAGTTFAVTVNCVTAAGGTTLSGIYSANGGNVPVVTVTASLPYRPLVAGIGFPLTARINAMEQAAVVGA